MQPQSTPHLSFISSYTAQRFWSKVNKTGPLWNNIPCWLWTVARTSTGYGHFNLDGRSVKAHRAAWEITHGPIPDKLLVLHRCDRPLCCNPAHLFLGTPADNSRDMVQKNRHGSQRGNRHKTRARPREGDTAMDEYVTVAAASHLTGVTERTLRRWITGRKLPAVDGNHKKLVRVGDVRELMAASGRPSGLVADTNGPGDERATNVIDITPGRRPDISGRPADSDRRLSDLAGSDLIGELVATIQQQAEEIGVLRERLRAQDAPHAAQDAPAAPQDSGAAPTPTARSVTSLRVRVLRWLRS